MERMTLQCVREGEYVIYGELEAIKALMKLLRDDFDVEGMSVDDEIDIDINPPPGPGARY